MDKRKPTILNVVHQDNHATLTLQVDSDILDFSGHFNHFPLLPGVTQIDWALHYAVEHLSTPSVFKGMEVIKFQDPIRPDAQVTLQLDWDSNKQKLAFKYSSQQGTVHSSGKMKLGEKSE